MANRYVNKEGTRLGRKKRKKEKNGRYIHITGGGVESVAHSFCGEPAEWDLARTVLHVSSILGEAKVRDLQHFVVADEDVPGRQVSVHYPFFGEIRLETWKTVSCQCTFTTNGQ